MLSIPLPLPAKLITALKKWERFIYSLHKLFHQDLGCKVLALQLTSSGTDRELEWSAISVKESYDAVAILRVVKAFQQGLKLHLVWVHRVELGMKDVIESS